MSDKASTEKQTTPSKGDTDGTNNQLQSGTNMASAAHSNSGIEKFANVGGSGGTPGGSKQGYEHLAEH